MFSTLVYMQKKIDRIFKFEDIEEISSCIPTEYVNILSGSFKTGYWSQTSGNRNAHIPDNLRRFKKTLPAFIDHEMNIADATLKSVHATQSSIRMTYCEDAISSLRYIAGLKIVESIARRNLNLELTHGFNHRIVSPTTLYF